MINPMRILVRLVLNRKFLEIISRCCATPSAIGCTIDLFVQMWPGTFKCMTDSFVRYIHTSPSSNPLESPRKCPSSTGQQNIHSVSHMSHIQFMSRIFCFVLHVSVLHQLCNSTYTQQGIHSVSHMRHVASPVYLCGKHIFLHGFQNIFFHIWYVRGPGQRPFWPARLRHSGELFLVRMPHSCAHMYKIICIYIHIYVCI